MSAVNAIFPSLNRMNTPGSDFKLSGPTNNSQGYKLLINATLLF